MRPSSSLRTHLHAAALSAALFAASPLIGEEAIPAEERLAGQLSRTAVRLLRHDPLPLSMMEASLSLIEEAAALAPDDPEIWRLVSAIASLLERSDVQYAALERVLDLDPNDEAARLRLMSREIRKAQTAEELVALFERLLEQQNREHDGQAISSRLALDLALLQRRRGETEKFADRLAQAVALDPANHRAAAVALGYFQAHVDDPVAEGELLMQLVLANPTDIEAHILFASHMLGFGAYQGAERLYTMALRSHRAFGATPAADLVADAAIAQFGSGDAEGALRRLEDHQRQTDLRLHQRLFYERPELSPLERTAHSTVLTPAFSAVRAAIAKRLGRDVEPMLEVAVQAYLRAIEETEASDSENQDRMVALLQLEMAWMLFWLGGPLEEARQALDAAKATAELSEAAEARFAGWEAIRLNEFSRAVTVLRPYAEQDVPARFGLAIALIEQGERRDGARELLAIARAQPGTLIGVLAADHLAELLGQRVALTQEAGALTEIAAKVPRVLDRLPQDASAAVSIRLMPERTRYGAYDPVMVNIEITNSSPIPLAIDPDGPIRPEVAIHATVESAGAPRVRFQPIIVGIDRRLRLMPRERMTVPVDLRQTEVGEFLDHYPLHGSILRLRAMLNFRATAEGALVPGLLGSETSPQSIRVDGARVTPAWVEEATESLSGPVGYADLPRISLLAFATGGDPAGMASEDRQLVYAARDAIGRSFAELDAVSQAWLIAVLPNIDAYDALIEPGRRTDDRLVQLAHILYRTRDATDPLLSEVRRGAEPQLRMIASLVHELLQEDESADRLWPEVPGEPELPADRESPR